MTKLPFQALRRDLVGVSRYFRASFDPGKPCNTSFQWAMPTGAIRLDLGLSERDIRQTVMIPSLLGDTATSP